MAFLDKTGLQALTKKLVQGDAIKVASSKGTTVKEVIDNIQRECESIALPNSMVLENRVNQFKIGQSRDINVSGNVEEGPLKIQLQGQTYQNLCKSDAGCSVQYASNYNIENYKDKIVVTRTSENNNGWTYCRNNTLKVNMIKTSTKYTLFFKYESNFNAIPSVQFMMGSAIQNLSNAYTATKMKDNIFMCVITTLSSFEDKEIGSQILYFHNATPRKIGDKMTLYKNMVLLEGDYSQIPIEEIPIYFEGIKSSFEDKVVNINVQGKNLFDGKLSTFNTNNTYIQNIGTYNNGSDNIPIKPNTNYVMTFETTSPDANIFIWNGDEKVSTVAGGKDIVSFKTPPECNSLSFYRDLTNYPKDKTNYKIQLEEGLVATLYEPYCNYNYKFDIQEPLRRLPNNIYDEIRNNNGKWELVRRTSKKVINGTEPWERSYSSWSNIVFCCSDNSFPGIRNRDVNTKNVIANTLPSLHIGSLCNGLGKTGICTHNWGTKKMQVAIRNIDTVEKLKTWFSNNPTEVIYELATPIITPIDPIQICISQETTVIINSDIAPISTHEVILNRSGQIEQGIELIANLRSRIDKLEKIYDSNLIATQYRLNNLKLNYELEREED